MSSNRVPWNNMEVGEYSRYMWNYTVQQGTEWELDAFRQWYAGSKPWITPAYQKKFELLIARRRISE